MEKLALKKDEILSLSPDKRVEKLAENISENNGVVPSSDNPDVCGYKAGLLKDLKVELAKLDSLRKGSDKVVPVDITLGEYIHKRYCIAPGENGTPENFYAALGIDASNTSIDSLMTMGEIDEGYRSIIPEVFRESVRLGLRRDPMYADIIRGEEAISQMRLTMPSINMSDAAPKVVGELETIETGTMSFGSKDVKIKKLGIGIKMSDESVRFSAINMLSIYMEDVGVKLAQGIDMLALETLTNGDQVGGSDSAPVIGVETLNEFSYFDLLRAWMQMGLIGNTPSAMIMNINPALDIMQMEEFKLPAPQYQIGANPSGVQAPTLMFKTPLPQNQAVHVHSGLPSSDYLMLVSKMNALIKLNASAMRVEMDRNASKQYDAYYVSLITGFATLKRDARLILDRTKLFTNQGFPSFMNVAAAEQVVFS